MTTQSRGKKVVKERKRSTTEHGTTLTSAFQQVRDLIVHGRLSPGAWIVEADLTEKLGMSRTPVRGALQWLQREGYVIEQKSRSKSRMIVAPLTREDSAELYSIVGHLEGLAGRLTVALPKEERVAVVAKIKAINAKLHKIAKTKDLAGESIFDLDAEFHRIIVEASAGPRLMLMHKGIKPQTERYWRLYASNIIDSLDVSVAEHEAIISAIHKGDADAAEKALIANWVKGAERVERVIAMHGERGSW
ncbi:GntR family transcriptional regulator [Granulicella sibirica]|uniref:Transcriptional regulator, GntR family n=1 Tax=Granulicella sibirica TaxID=2479048 RepID=A0A4Q0SZ70_9BACT|nr:GntR family transcriptional regulator [Granulicella sibirica]RXH54366.1 Transcriptional regulator, GntR family [Granulicella sibirica]